MTVAETDVVKAEGHIQDAKASLQQAKDELETKSELQRRNPAIVPQRDIEKLQVVVEQRQGTVDAATASKQSAIVRISTVLPAEKATAEAALAQAQVVLDKTFIRAGVNGRVEQFFSAPATWSLRLCGPRACLFQRAAAGGVAGRLWPDRGSGDEGWHGGGSDLHIEAVGHYSNGRHQCAGLHRGRRGPSRRATD